MKAYYYHLHHILFKEDIPYWKSLIKDTFNSTILELGCGTGRVMKLLLESPNYNSEQKIVGLDNDPEMLNIAKRIHKENQQFSFIEADMLTMNLNKKFPLVILPCNTFSVFSSDEQTQLLQQVKSHLLPDGKFVFSQPNPAIFDSIPDSIEPEIEVILQNKNTNNAVMVSSEWQCGEEKFVMQWHYDEMFSDGEVKRTSLHTAHYRTSVKSIKQLLKSNGFIIQAIYGDFDRSPYSKNSDNLIIESSF